MNKKNIILFGTTVALFAGNIISEVQALGKTTPVIPPIPRTPTPAVTCEYFKAAPGFFDFCKARPSVDGKVGIYCHDEDDYGTVVCR